jgi:four helix bundle protein
VVWQKSVDLTIEVYRLIREFPREEIYGLTSQLRRAAVSVASNIAEGYARRTTRELVQFVAVAEGSLAEVQTQLIIGGRLGYLHDGDAAEAHQLVIECQRMLNAMQSTLQERIRNGTSRR